MNISIRNGHIASRSSSRLLSDATRIVLAAAGLAGVFSTAGCASNVNGAGDDSSGSGDLQDGGSTSRDDASIAPDAAGTGGDSSPLGIGDAATNHVDGAGGGPTNPVDATAPGVDSGAPGADGGMSPIDSGHGQADSGIPQGNDAGSQGNDAGHTGGQDAGMTAPDASGPTADAAVDSGGGAVSTCTTDLPAGWTLALFNTSLTSCPSGFDEHVVAGTPAIGTGACSCSCSVGAPGQCGQGSLAMLTNPGHGNDTCSIAWFTAQVSGSQCVAVPAAAQGTFGNFQASPLPAAATGGTCSSTAQTNQSAVSEPAQRFCDVPTASADAVCNGSPPSGFSACIMSSGQVACPASTAFTQKFTVEDSATLSCGACSACGVTTTCSNPMVSVFASANCAGAAAGSFAVNGTCIANNNEAPTVLSMQYTETTQATCTAGTSAASAQLVGPRTICCR
jgi:hypothetical protein